MNCNVIDRKKVENFSSFILKTTFKSDGGDKLSSINCSIFFTFSFDFHLLSFLVVCSCVSSWYHADCFPLKKEPLISLPGKGKSHKEPAPDDQPLPSPSSANKVPVSRQQEIFSCVFCSTTCNNRENLKRHVEINHNNPFETYLHYCEYCGRGFKSKEGFVLHTRMFHTETEKFPQCQICGKRFHCASSYKTHMYSHSGQKRYKCLKCHKSYKNKVTWTKHVCRR